MQGRAWTLARLRALSGAGALSLDPGALLGALGWARASASAARQSRRTSPTSATLESRATVRLALPEEVVEPADEAESVRLEVDVHLPPGPPRDPARPGPRTSDHQRDLALGLLAPDSSSRRALVAVCLRTSSIGRSSSSPSRRSLQGLGEVDRPLWKPSGPVRQGIAPRRATMSSRRDLLGHSGESRPLWGRGLSTDAPKVNREVCSRWLPRPGAMSPVCCRPGAGNLQSAARTTRRNF